MKISLVIMAAGMGSRYGGSKQVDGLGPHGEILMEYSIYDALRAGFAVEYDGASGIDPGEAQGFICKAPKVFPAAHLHAAGGKIEFLAQVIAQDIRKIAVCEKYHEKKRNDGNGHRCRKNITEYALFHTTSPILYPTPRTVQMLSPAEPGLVRRVPI